MPQAPLPLGADVPLPSVLTQLLCPVPLGNNNNTDLLFVVMSLQKTFNSTRFKTSLWGTLLSPYFSFLFSNFLTFPTVLTLIFKFSTLINDFPCGIVSGPLQELTTLLRFFSYLVKDTKFVWHELPLPNAIYILSSFTATLVSLILFSIKNRF